jgi:hypothetical protein
MIQYFLPFVVITAASLALLSNMDRKLVLMTSAINEQSHDLIREKSKLICLQLVRQSKYSIITFATVLFFLFSFCYLCVLSYEYFINGDIKSTVENFITYAQIINWVLVSFIISHLNKAYEYLHINIHIK